MAPFYLRSPRPPRCIIQAHAIWATYGLISSAPCNLLSTMSITAIQISKSFHLSGKCLHQADTEKLNANRHRQSACDRISFFSRIRAIFEHDKQTLYDDGSVKDVTSAQSGFDTRMTHSIKCLKIDCIFCYVHLMMLLKLNLKIGQNIPRASEGTT